MDTVFEPPRITHYCFATRKCASQPPTSIAHEHSQKEGESKGKHRSNDENNKAAAAQGEAATQEASKP